MIRHNFMFSYVISSYLLYAVRRNRGGVTSSMHSPPYLVSRALKGVDYVIHAAALKQISACEYNPLEAIKRTLTKPAT